MRLPSYRQLFRPVRTSGNGEAFPVGCPRLPRGVGGEANLPPMARASDTFTAAQAAQVLGISERRVRQLVSEGKLAGRRGDDNVVRVPQQAVNEERRRRRANGRGAASTVAGPARRTRRVEADGVDVDVLAEKVASVVGQRLEGQLEITQRAESMLQAELHEERARRMDAEARLADSRAELADLHARLDETRRHSEAMEAQLQQAQQRRGLFRRG